MICQHCKSEIPENVAFCPKCGSKIEQQPKVLFCANCGQKLEEGTEFCPMCGTKAGVTAIGTGVEKPVRNKKKPASRKWAGVLCALAVVIVAAAVGIPFIGKKLWENNYKKAIDAFIPYYEEFYEDNQDYEEGESYEKLDCGARFMLDADNNPVMLIADCVGFEEAIVREDGTSSGGGYIVDVHLIEYKGGRAKERAVVQRTLVDGMNAAAYLRGGNLYVGFCSGFGYGASEYWYQLREDEFEEMKNEEWEYAKDYISYTGIGERGCEGGWHRYSLIMGNITGSADSTYNGSDFVDLLEKLKEEIVHNELEVMCFYYEDVCERHDWDEKPGSRPVIWRDGLYYEVVDENTLQFLAADYREEKQTIRIPAKVEGCVVKDKEDANFNGGTYNLWSSSLNYGSRAMGEELEELTLIYEDGFDTINGMALWMQMGEGQDTGIRYKVEIPASVTTIKEKGYYYNGLTKVDITKADLDFSNVDLTIYGEKGSAAEEFADKYDIDFKEGSIK